MLTPLALVLVVVETTDLVFALDSIPAIFAITAKPFIVFTSNVFAILGLRSLYFVLAGAIGYFRYLKYGLSLVLVFIGGKMLVEKWVPIPIHWSLLIVVAILLTAVLASIIAAAAKEMTRSRSALEFIPVPFNVAPCRIRRCRRASRKSWRTIPAARPSP